MADDQDLNDQNQDNEEPLGDQISGAEELLFALASAVRAKKSKEAIGALIQTYANEMPVNARRAFRLRVWGWVFTVVLVIVVGGMGKLGIITGETVGAILGIIVGAMYSNSKK